VPRPHSFSPKCPTIRPNSLHPFVAPQSRSRDYRQDRRLVCLSRRSGVGHDPRVIGKMAAHVVLPWVHRVFSNLKVWALGVYHGLRASISNPTSTSSSFASTAAEPATPPSAPCSASPPATRPLSTKC